MTFEGNHHTDVTKERQSVANIGKRRSPKTEFKKGNKPVAPFKKGQKWSGEIEQKRRKNISKALIGRKHTKETRDKMVGPVTQKHKDNISKSLTGRRLSKEHIRNMLRRREKSSLESKFEQIINKFGLPYSFVGNGDFLIERKNPDFINTNGEKRAVEVFYRPHKEMFRGGVEKWIQERTITFEKYGWAIEFFDETQVNEAEIMNRLGGV